MASLGMCKREDKRKKKGQSQEVTNMNTFMRIFFFSLPVFHTTIFAERMVLPEQFNFSSKMSKHTSTYFFSVITILVSASVGNHFNFIIIINLRPAVSQ